MKYLKLFENFNDYDPYELMMVPPYKKGEMLFKEIEKRDKANLNLVRDLITLGANLDWQNEDGQTVLHKCARWNSPEIARMLLDAGADVNVQDGDGWTALHVSAFNNRLEITQVLIDAGADKTIPNNDGELPYELAKTQELKELLKL